MEKAFEKAGIGIAANPVHSFPKKFTHVTTGTFMQFGLATVMEVPKSHTKCNHKTFMRSFPLKRPLLSNINIHKQAYFVPYRTVWEPWSDFREDVPHNQPAGTGIIAHTPLIDLTTLVSLFKTSYYSTGTATMPSDLEHGCDFVTKNGNVNNYYTFTNYGRWAYKLFCSMGLRIPFASTLGKDATIDALPFLAVAKVYLDYFFPNQYAHYGIFATIDGIFQRQVTYTLTQGEIDTILNAMYKVSYGSDYFISAFDSPLMAAHGVQSGDFQITDVSLKDVSGVDVAVSSVIDQAPNGTPIAHGQDDDMVFNFSQYVDSHLKALSRYIKRHSLAGSRALTRYLADWGVTLDADKLKRCYKLGECTFPVQVGDVIAQSDTYNADTGEGAQLGDYAGRSVAYNGDFSFDFDTKEDGLIVVTYSIVPSVSYVQGIHRYWFHKTKLDFLNGDFDGLSVREIRQCELFAGTKRAVDMDKLFAFIPTYAEYKIDYDVQSGDFAVDTKNLGLFGFESARLFEDSLGSDAFNVTHSLNFIQGNDSLQYNRIFFEDEGLADKFVLIHRAEFDSQMPALPLWDSYDFEDGKQKLKMSVNGSKDN